MEGPAQISMNAYHPMEAVIKFVLMKLAVTTVPAEKAIT